MIKEYFMRLISNYKLNNNLKFELWHEIERHYSDPERHYHTLNHLEHLHAQLLAIMDKIVDWETVQFSLFYHDIIYNPLATDNEEQSAELAATRMKSIAVPEKMIEQCTAQILATKNHNTTDSADTNYFTDADLSILGADENDYKAYAQNVRKEYAVYPDELYNAGRKKVLQHFLHMQRIFKTDYFHAKFEEPARVNLGAELDAFSLK